MCKCPRTSGHFVYLTPTFFIFIRMYPKKDLIIISIGSLIGHSKLLKSMVYFIHVLRSARIDHSYRRFGLS